MSDNHSRKIVGSPGVPFKSEVSSNPLGEAAAPLDVKASWLSIARRLQAAAANSGNQGFATVKIVVLFDEHGNARIWSTPVVRMIEPKRMKDDILTLLSG
jgi:hypothetical protein